VVKPNGTAPQPKIEKEKTPEGWMAVTGVTTLKENNVEYALMLVTASGFGKVTSVLAKVVGESYMQVIESFLTTMKLDATASSQNTVNASTSEIIDNISLQIPAGWQLNKQTGFTQLTYSNTQQKSFCQAAFYAAQPSTGDKQKDFENEWKEIVEKNFTVLTFASPEKLKDKKGNSFLRKGAKGTDKGGNKYYVQLNVFDCNKSIQSVLVVSGTQQQLQQYESSWQSLISEVKKDNTGIKTTSVLTTDAIPPPDKKIVGIWGKVYSVIGAYTNDLSTNLAFSGYKRGQYAFKTDGTYSFQGENWGGTVNNEKFKLKNNKEYGLIDEIGTYQQTGNKLKIMPLKNMYRVVQEDGKLLRSENLALEKREYTWQTYYAVGMEETRLVLTANSENFFDGDFSTYEPAVSFPKSFGYALNKSMFFKFQPLNLTTPASAAINEKILGKWAKSASSPPQYQNGTVVNLVNAGYHKGQYEFKPDGTYSFHGESQFSSNDFGLTDEKGNYLVSGNQVILTPSSATIRKVDANGALKKSENLPLSKRVYSWQLHYFEGINETNLVLSGISENMVDGGYGSNSQFPNSFLYSREFLPEWRFK
jgi:hypothetical protein